MKIAAKSYGVWHMCTHVNKSIKYIELKRPNAFYALVLFLQEVTKMCVLTLLL